MNDGEASQEVASPGRQVPAEALSIDETGAAVKAPSGAPSAGVSPSEPPAGPSEAPPGPGEGAEAGASGAPPGAVEAPAPGDSVKASAPSEAVKASAPNGAAEAPSPGEVEARAAAPKAGEGGAAPSARLRVVLNFDEKSSAERGPSAEGRGADEEDQAFFAGADEAVARVREAALAEMREESLSYVPTPPTPTQLARRDRARRAVTYLMGGAALLCGLGFVHFSRERGHRRAVASEQAALVGPAAGPAAATHAELSRRASASFEQRRYREAIEHASRAVEADPAEAGPYVVWGKALVEAGRPDEAKRVFERCLERAASGPKDQCGLGVR